MSNQDNSEGHESGRSSSAQTTGATHEERLADRLPAQERNQPDPVLQLSVGRLGAGPIALVAIIAAIILAVVFYGLNSPAPNTHDVATPKTAASAPAAAGGANPAAPGMQPSNAGGHG